MKQAVSWMMIAAAVAGLAGAPAVRAEVRLSRVFSENMVLQRDRAIPVWGWANPGEVVTVRLDQQTVRATADAQGRWKAQLPAAKASVVPLTFEVKGANTITFTNVLVGDVWLCSGQSNMEWGLGACDALEDVRAATNALIRHIKINVNFQTAPVDDPPTGGWHMTRPDTIHWNTAVGYYFARRIQQETGVPIGILNSSVGGTAIEPWTPPLGLNETPELAKEREEFAKRKQEYAAALAKALDPMQAWIAETRQAIATGAEVPPMPALPPNPTFTPGQIVGWHALYNGMIHPIVPYGIKGALWYQGEANGGEDQTYINKTKALVGSWRKLWGQDFPFYYVQLANWQAPNDNPAGGDGWARIRCAQTRTLSVIPKTGMAVIIDIGDANDIHPRNKFDVGERLARWALAKDYGRTGLVYSGPLFKEMKVEGGKVRLLFDHTGSGLMVGTKDGRAPAAEAAGVPLKRFAIAGEDKKWVWADAVIENNTVVVSSPQVPNPVAVRYAFAMNPEGANLYNKEGLPASPFRTDAW